MKIVSSQSRDAVEYLWNGKKGKLVSIQEWTRAIYGHATPKLQRATVDNISRFRKFAESRGYGMLISVHEQVGMLTRVTHVVLADHNTNPKYTAYELTRRQARAQGFLRSRDRGIRIVVKDRLLPIAEMHRALGFKSQPLMLPPADQEKALAAAAKRAEEASKPKVGKPVRLHP